MVIKIFLILLLCTGCAVRGKIRPITDIKDVKSERDGILKAFDRDKIIILAYEKIYSNTFDIAKNFYQYKKVTEETTYDGFYIWLLNNLWRCPHLIEGRKRASDYKEIQKNYDLLEELFRKGALYEKTE